MLEVTFVIVFDAPSSEGPPIQSTGPPRTGAGVGIGIFDRKIIVNRKRKPFISRK